MNLISDFANPVNKIILCIIVVIVATILSRVITRFLNRMKKFSEDMTSIYLLRDIITCIIYFLALMIILDAFGINLTSTLISLGVVGIAVSLAAKDMLSNFFSGLALIMGKSIKVGDTIKIKDKKGIVEEINLRTTIIYDDNGVKDHIPNSILTNNPYLQYKLPEKNRADILAGIPLNVDIEEFKKYIVEKIESYDTIAENPKPNVYAKCITFEESTVKISFWVKDFNSKDEYKLIITNEIRKYVNKIGEINE